MSARAIGDFAAGLFNRHAASADKIRRTGAPVHRNSYDADSDCRATEYWQQIADGTRQGGRRWTRRYLQVAKEWDRFTKGRGDREGQIGYRGLYLLELLLDKVDYATGALFPSYDTMVKWTGWTRETVCNALKRLRDTGFLRWSRRTEKTDNEGLRGPQIRQISNAYGFDLKALPKRAYARFMQLVKPSPVPDDIASRREEETANMHAMQAGVDAGSFGDALAVECPELRRAINAADALAGNASRMARIESGSKG